MAGTRTAMALSTRRRSARGDGWRLCSWLTVTPAADAALQLLMMMMMMMMTAIMTMLQTLLQNDVLSQHSSAIYSISSA